MSHVPNYEPARQHELPVDRGAAYPGAGGALDIGASLNETLAIFGRRFVPLVILLVILTVPLLVVGLGLGALVGAGVSQTGIVIASVITVILAMIATLLAQTAATVAVVDDLHRQPFSIGHALNVTLRRLMPILGVTFLMSLTIVLGSLLLMNPGPPRGHRTTDDPSHHPGRFLTKEQRWRIFGVIVIDGIATALVGTLIEYLGRAFGAIAGIIVDVLWQSVSGAFGAVLTAVVYYRLRILKDGVDIAAIANVFN